MEQQQQPQAPNDQQHGSGNSTSGKSSNTRWAPTTEQIRILKELYYNNGVRSPSTEQIQRIAAKLRRYGKVEGKNVFYWFQNHKARERQKNRFTITDPHKSSFHKEHQNNFTAALHNVGGVSSSSSGVVGVGQMGGFGSYGPVNMEMNFRDCSISSAGGGNGLNGGASIMSNNNNNNSNSWFRIDPYSSSHVNLFSQRSKSVKESFEFNRRYHHQEEDEDDEGGDPTAQIETLPLFPMHGEDIIHGFDDIDSESDGGCCIGSGRTPPELSLFPFNC